MPAQDLPVLPQDPAIRKGVLPNGTSYYIAANPTIKGLADFALVQKTGVQNIDDTLAIKAVSTAREALTWLPRCKDLSPQTFFTSHGVVPGKDGFVNVSKNATTFHFKDVLLDSPAVLDSSLLVMMDIVDRVSTTEDPFLKKWYSPSDQAVIVAGDVDASAVEYKLKIMSMMTPASDTSSRKQYIWTPADTAEYVCIGSPDGRLASVSATWRSSRPPVEYMNTVQPTIYEMFLIQLGMISEEMVENELKRKDIPVADVSSSFRTGIQSPEDESFTVSVSVPKENLLDAVSALASAMSSIEAGRTDMNDLIRVKLACVDIAHKRSLRPIKSNAGYVEKCAASFLYNGDMSSVKTKMDFMSSRSLSDSTELRLFNGIAEALLDSAMNLSVAYTGDIPADSVSSVFNAEWSGSRSESVKEPSVYPAFPDYTPSAKKIKIRSEKKDPMSGANVWDFSNGFKVIYKKLDTGGKIYYDMALNGGFGFIPDLVQGEGGYIGDCLFLSTIAGMDASDFLKVLAINDIHMDSYVGLPNMMLSGSAPEDKVSLLMRALLAVANERKADEESARYYARSESLRYDFIRGSVEERKIKINRIMCPDYNYISYKGLDSISLELMTKADRYFESQFSKMNDGVLVLVGDVDEDQLKKTLLSYVGGFRVTDRAFRRPSIRYRPASGWSTYTVEGDENSVDVAVSVPILLTADNFMAAEIASLVLEKHLAEAVMDTGMYLEVTHECRIYPQERLSVIISLREASQDGYSSATELSGPIEALAILRSALSDMSSFEITDEEMKTMKVQVKSALKLEMKDPYYWMNVISRRYLAGKDFTTGSEAKIDAVTVDKVKEILSALNNGAKVEYITSKK